MTSHGGVQPPLVRDEDGELPRAQDHPLPSGDLDRIQAARTNPGPPMVERIAQEWRAQVAAEIAAIRAVQAHTTHADEPSDGPPEPCVAEADVDWFADRAEMRDERAMWGDAR